MITDDKQKLDLIRLQMQQAESVRTHYQSPDVAFRIPVLQSLAMSLPLSIGLTLVVWFLVPPASDLWNDWFVLAAWEEGIELPRIPDPKFWQAAFYIVLTFALSFLLSFRRFYLARQDNWDSLIWNLEERLQIDLTGDEQIGEPERSYGDRIDRVAHLILERHYLDGQDASRDACEEAGLCSQREWNYVNRILQKIGVKGERGFVVDDYQKALSEYRKRVSVFDEAIQIRHAVGNGSERISLTG